MPKPIKIAPESPVSHAQPEGNTNLPRANKQELIAQAIDQHADGMSLRQIAEQIGVSHTAIRKWLLTAGDQYKQAQISGLTQRIIEADEMLETATDPVSIARAREIARYARWDAERRLPHLFGQKQLIEQSVTVTLDNQLANDAGSLLSRVRGRVFDAETQQSDDVADPQQITCK